MGGPILSRKRLRRPPLRRALRSSRDLRSVHQQQVLNVFACSIGKLFVRRRAPLRRGPACGPTGLPLLPQRPLPGRHGPTGSSATAVEQRVPGGLRPPAAVCLPLSNRLGCACGQAAVRLAAGARRLVREFHTSLAQRCDRLLKTRQALSVQVQLCARTASEAHEVVWLRDSFAVVLWGARVS